MRPALLLLCLLLTGCGGDCGPIPFCFDFRQDDTKEEVTRMHTAWCEWSKPYERLSYQGSDATHHHYFGRPVDWFVTFRIPRAQLTVKDKRELLKVPDSHYLVNPSQDIWERVGPDGKRLR